MASHGLLVTFKSFPTGFRWFAKQKWMTFVPSDFWVSSSDWLDSVAEKVYTTSGMCLLLPAVSDAPELGDQKLFLTSFVHIKDFLKILFLTDHKFKIKSYNKISISHNLVTVILAKWHHVHASQRNVTEPTVNKKLQTSNTSTKLVSSVLGLAPKQPQKCHIIRNIFADNVQVQPFTGFLKETIICVVSWHSSLDSWVKT